MLLVGLCAWIVMPLARTSWLTDTTCWFGEGWMGGYGLLGSGSRPRAGFGGLDPTTVGFCGTLWMMGVDDTGTLPEGGMPKMPWRVLATSSGSAYESRTVSSFSGPRARASAMSASDWNFLRAASASFSSASARLVRLSLSDLTWASCTRACASRSLVSCSIETIRMMPLRSSR